MSENQWRRNLQSAVNAAGMSGHRTVPVYPDDVQTALDCAARALPEKVPEVLVWRAEGSRIWTGTGWIHCGRGELHLAETIVAAHNGVLSGLFGTEAMPS